MSKDIFICHASDDKNTIVRPLADALQTNGISFWLDEAEIQWGDSIIQKVNEGLNISQFVIVVLSTAFINKNWPQRELNSVLNIEASTGEVKVLPLIVGDEEERKNIFQKYPLLNDKLYLIWDGTVDSVISAIQNRLS